MKKIKMYRYIGLNGTLTTYILLDGVKHTVRYHLSADEGKLLTDGDKKAKIVEIDAENLDNWYEINDPEANLNK
jgi:hypothetical protein